ncbi:MAG: hypothetical protein MRJ65_00805 [Candidatus Brocadiaceae bacterium]|nr:hypothetical protein [Candidatus Brocadiaceae bacterium]
MIAEVITAITMYTGYRLCILIGKNLFSALETNNPFFSNGNCVFFFSGIQYFVYVDMTITITACDGYAMNGYRKITLAIGACYDFRLRQFI